MRRVIGLVLIAFMVIGGCGGGSGGEDCDFDFNSFLNGPNAQSIESQWLCASNAGEFIFVAFEDGTGESTGIGVFTYQQTGCRRAEFQSGVANGEIFDLEGSVLSGILTFKIDYDDPEFIDENVGCLLQVL